MSPGVADGLGLAGGSDRRHGDPVRGAAREQTQRGLAAETEVAGEAGTTPAGIPFLAVSVVRAASAGGVHVGFSLKQNT
jgi:hypothetical protein